MAKDTGLREEKCLGELPKGGTEPHTNYNASGWEIYELGTDSRQQTIDRRQEIADGKTWNLEPETWNAREARSDLKPGT